MKHTIHSKIGDFEFVETEIEEDTVLEDISIGELFEKHRSIVEIAKPQTGMDSRDFNAVLDDYLTNNKIVGDPGMFEKMSVEQAAILQAIKRSRARTK